MAQVLRYLRSASGNAKYRLELFQGFLGVVVVIGGGAPCVEREFSGKLSQQVFVGRQIERFHLSLRRLNYFRFG